MAQTQKIALVTGAGTGVGREVSLALMQEGYSVVLAGRRIDLLQTLVSKAHSTGATALAHETDVTDINSVASLFQEIDMRFGRIDLLFNNAGTTAPPLPLEEITLEQWRKVIDTNLTGTFLCTQQAVRLMRRQVPSGGRIINNGSVSAHVPRLNAAAYTASKHAITGLTRATALEGRQWGIACGQIDIGNAATPMADGYGLTAGVLQADGSVQREPMMSTDNAVRAVLTMASMPLDANILFLTVMATKMPYVGRG